MVRGDWVVLQKRCADLQRQREQHEDIMEGYFVHYPKIFNGTKVLASVGEESRRTVDSVEWCVTEKIHGANFSFICDGKNVACAKRNALLGPEDNFFGHRAFVDRVQAQVLVAFDMVHSDFPDLKVLYVYGEVFGGLYENPSVEQGPPCQPVQLEVQYCPGSEFYAFDMGLGLEGACDPCHFVGYQEAMKVFEAVGINHLKPLFVGNLNEALNYPSEFETTIPGLLRLPPLGKPNLAEGIVVKPFQDLYLTTHGDEERLRPCFKVKNEKFLEDSRAPKNRQKQRKAAKENSGQTSSQWPGYEVLIWEANSLATATRVTSAISKLGHVTSGNKKQTKELFKEVMEDILVDLGENEPSYHDLTPEQTKQVRIFVSDLVGELLKGHFQKEKEMKQHD